MRPADTFAGLGGDSLSYVELALRLENRIGRLPADWPDRSIAELAALAGPARRRRGWVRLDTTIALRAIAIILIVINHATVNFSGGGAHVLVAVAGANFARFLLAGSDRDRTARILRTAAAIAVPSMIWIGAMSLVEGGFSWRGQLLLNQLLLPADWDDWWRWWFIEDLVYLLIGTAALLLVPGVAARARRSPFGFPMLLLALALVPRVWSEVPGISLALLPYRPAFVVWLFVGGWAAARASTWRQRFVLSVVMLAAVTGFTSDPQRNAIIAAGLLALIWLPTLPWPRLLVGVTGLLASSSLFIYLTNFLVTDHVEPWSSTAAVIAALVVGVATWAAADRISRWVASRTPGAQQAADTSSVSFAT